MSKFCSSCGQQARPDDRFCVGCGNEINADAAPATGASFPTPEDARRRTGNFVVRHGRALMALAVVSAIAVAVALSSSSDTSPTAADAAPAADVAGEQAAQDATTTVSAPAAKPRQHNAKPKAKPKTKPSPKPVAVRGSNGKTYMCDLSALVDAEAKKAVVKRRDKVLTTRRRAVRALMKKYPGATAPPAVVDRYHWLLARANAQVTFTNKAIRVYNQVLQDKCRPT